MRTVPITSFVAAMESQWAEYRNVCSDPLRTVWAKIATAMNAQIESPSLPRPVIPAELGAGKTTGTKMYAALMAQADLHPGILIVTPTIEQALDYERDINERAATKTAMAWYSRMKPKPSLGEIANTPTVIICHRSYETALDELMVDEDERYEKFMTFRGAQRRLVVVDEALEQVYIPKVEHNVLHWLRGLMSARLIKAHRDAVRLFHAVELAMIGAPASGNAVVSPGALLAGTGLSVEQAHDVIKALWKDLAPTIHNLDDRNIAKETLTALRRNLAAYCWTESDKYETALVSSRLLLPPGAGQVFLDGTAKLNSVYTGRSSEFSILKMPQVRDYRQVNWYVARVNLTGKWAMKNEGEQIARETLPVVLEHYGERVKERRVLVVTHEIAEEATRSIWSKAGFAELSVDHWNNINGRNDWREYDTLVTLSIPWATRTLDLARWMAICGVQLDDEGLNTQPLPVLDVRENRIAAELAQAMGRIRIRQMVDEDGRCLPCDVFSRCGHTHHLQANTEKVIANVQKALRGIRPLEWPAASTARTPNGRRPSRRRQIEAKLLEMAGQMTRGRQEIDRKALGWSNGSIDRALINATTVGHPLRAELEKLGVRIERGGYQDGVRGKVLPALVKSASCSQST
jgi:hypothetical protein